MSTTFLSDDEVAEFCDPLTQPCAQVRFFQKLGIPVRQKPNKRPLVARSIVEQILRGSVPPSGTGTGPTQAASTGPDFDGLVNFLEKKPKRNGM